MATDKTKAVSVRLANETVEAIEVEAEGVPLGTYIRRILENRFSASRGVGTSDRRVGKSRTPVLRDVDAES